MWKQNFSLNNTLLFLILNPVNILPTQKFQNANTKGEKRKKIKVPLFTKFKYPRSKLQGSLISCIVKKNFL